VVVTDQYGRSTEANVTLRNDAYNLTLSGYIREPLENLTFALIPLIDYNLTVSNGFGTQSYIVYTGQTRQIQIDTLPEIQKVFYIMIGAVAGIVIGCLAGWMIARRKRKSLSE